MRSPIEDHDSSSGLRQPVATTMNPTSPVYEQLFRQLTPYEPHPWQRELGEEPMCSDRLLRIPTGFGKTLGVLGAWLHHRMNRGDDSWPRRLVWCLPMRVLVEQTQAEARAALERLNLLWDERSSHEGKVGVHLLMGGADASDWHLHPEQSAVLIGTQDMLLSRAMNRGYGAHRARWPIDFGLLNHDCLWVLDEVQLMDVGLATSAQLQAFREQRSDAGQATRPCRSWWMSATLQRSWIQKSPETRQWGETIPQSQIPENGRKGPLWEEVSKPLRVEKVKDSSAIAKLVTNAHLEAGSGKSGPTLVVVNTVDSAVELIKLLKKSKELKGTDFRLVHSRFRPHERAGWRESFLNRSACAPGTNRIVVATQVIEAGVDISAGVLLTELAPWPSLVQRFGRAARWGGRAAVIVLDREPKDDKAAAPYLKDELDAARHALTFSTNGSPLALEEFEEAHPELLSTLYPYAPRHLLLSHELDDLFDTTPDLSGADIDISRFIRSGEERDLQVFWQDVVETEEPTTRLRPAREALCSVPFLKARDWLCGKESASTRAPRLKEKVRAWVWDWLGGEWRRAERKDLYPGQTVLVASSCGGYDLDLGWSPDTASPVSTIIPVEPSREESADAAEDNEDLSKLGGVAWQTIAVHGAQVGREAAGLSARLVPGLERLLDLAGRWHDTGKAHAVFQNSIQSTERPVRRDLAKAPNDAWLPPKKMYPDENGSARRGFRHELASATRLFSVLIEHAPEHQALLGPWKELFEAMDGRSTSAEQRKSSPSSLEREIIGLTAEEFDLLAYLVCSHHGKVRMAWHASPADQEASDTVVRIRGIREGDLLPAFPLMDADGQFVSLGESRLTLAPASLGLSSRTGRGWTERVLQLLSRHGPFQLAYLETLLRVADQRASKSPVADALVTTHHSNHELAGSSSTLESTRSGGAAEDTAATHSSGRGQKHGLRGGTSGSGDAGEGVRATASSTRYVDTLLGMLSYAELAPHLSLQVQQLELEIVSTDFRDHELDEGLLQFFHQRVCAQLTPKIAGRWRNVDVQVGTHVAPAFHEVALLMRDYCLDLQARMAALDSSLPSEDCLELLAFAEGRLLSIHPFEDFNGRVTRLFLLELVGRLELPSVDLTPEAGVATKRYLDALRAADQRDWHPLTITWRERFETEATE